MRPHPPTILKLAAFKPLLRLVLLTLTMGGLATAHAGETWRIDPEHSFAHLFLGVDSNALEVGVARVSGVMDVDSENPPDPTMSFEIRPENGIGAEHATISFASGPTTSSDGKLVFTGKLTVTRIERSITADPSEAYSGPQYGSPVVYSETRQVKLVFSDTPLRQAHNGSMELSGSISVNREDFPQFQGALTLDDWPTQLVNDEVCTAPSTIGEDFHGFNCTGSVVASVRNAEVPTGVSSGEGFYGSVPAVTPNKDWSSIILNLQLERIPSTSSAVTTDSALPIENH